MSSTGDHSCVSPNSALTGSGLQEERDPPRGGGRSPKLQVELEDSLVGTGWEVPILTLFGVRCGKSEGPRR